MLTAVVRLCQTIIANGLKWFEQRLQQLTRPSTISTIVGAITDLTRSKSELMVENALLRQQLVVLKRSVKRPRLTHTDRRLLVVLASRLKAWQSALILVKPETVVSWHRHLFKIVWRYKSRPGVGRPALAQDLVLLIRRMAQDNPLWGVERIRGELLKLGVHVNKATIRKYVRPVRRHSPARQTWTTFVRNHAQDIWACDFLPVIDLFFRIHYVFFIMKLRSREIVHFGVTDAPTDAWTAQQLREATPFGEGPKYLIRDNDGKYAQQFTRVAAGSQIQVLRTPVRAPRANALCERFLGSVRRECLDHLLIVDQHHLHRVLKEYVRYFNHQRSYQGIQQTTPLPPQPPRDGTFIAPGIVCEPVLGGLHHTYHRAA
jgi:putative transposase